MISFGETLKQCINEQGISVNSFTKATGLNRGWLYNIFAGVKKLPEDKFHAILRDISFTSANEELLREAFYRDVFGNSEYENIMCIINFFNKTFAESCAVQPERPDNFVRPAAGIFPVDEDDFFNALRSVIHTEIERSAKPVIHTNFPYTSDTVDNCLYSALRASSKTIVLNHLVRFESKGHTKNNLQNILKSLRYLQLRQIVHFFYSDSVSAEITGTLFPYFVITASGALLFNASGSKGLFIHNEPAVLAELCNQGASLVSKCKPLAAYPENILELKDLVEPAAYTGVTSYLQYYPCWAQFADSDLLGKIMHPALPFRESIIQIAERYYADIIHGNPLHFFTLSGVAEFINNGRFYEAPELMVPPLTYSLRVYVLEKLIEHIRGSAGNFFILDERKLSIPKSIEISYCEGCVTIFSMVSDDEEAYLGQCVVHLQDKSIADDFRNFHDYFLRNGFVHAKDYALRGLSDLLAICKEHETNEKAD